MIFSNREQLAVSPDSLLLGMAEYIDNSDQRTSETRGSSLRCRLRLFPQYKSIRGS